MTKEIGDIINAYKVAQQQGRQTALATVVMVEGSSYRRPGARMLIEDNGSLTGAISGGCLDGDAFRKAMLAIIQQQNKLVTYDTLDDDGKFGVQLGCNGIVHILFEPIDPNQPNNPLAYLERSCLEAKDAVLVTVISMKNIHSSQPGTCFLYNGDEAISNIDDKNLEKLIKEDAVKALANSVSFPNQYYNGELTAFVELVQPPVSLIIVGAGNDALPLVEMAALLGWQITIIDGRAAYANKQRFPRAHKIVVGKPAEAIKAIVTNDRTVFVLMTHNYNYDYAMLELVLKTKGRYIGILGPKKRLDRMLVELVENGNVITDQQRSLIYGPTGLDLGAEAAEEIALSVLAEIKAVLSTRPGTFLRDKTDTIHLRSEFMIDEVNPRD